MSGPRKSERNVPAALPRMRLLPLWLSVLATGAAAQTPLPALQVPSELLSPADRGKPRVVQRRPDAATTPAATPANASPPAKATGSEAVRTPAARAATPPTDGKGAKAAAAKAPAAVAPSRPPLQPSGPAGTTVIDAQRFTGTQDVEWVAEGEAQLARDDLHVSADRLHYKVVEDEVSAEGAVVMRRGDDSVSGPRAQLKLDEQTGEFEAPRYALSAETSDGKRKVSGSGAASVLRMEGENQYRLENGTWSTCRADDPDWYLQARELKLDYDREVGDARDTTLIFKDTPILWMPWAEFPLASQRQSGIITPTFGTSNKTGFDLALPYYLNLAPNYDATITPRFMGRRGLQLGGEFRYLGDTYRGVSRVEVMPRDEVTGGSRAAGAIQHTQAIVPGLIANVDFNAVSDPDYFRDLSSRLTATAQSNLLRQASLGYYGAELWDVSALFQSYQTLTGGVKPYRRTPQLNFNAGDPYAWGGSALAMRGEYVRFTHPDDLRDTGSRLILNPEWSLPIVQPGWFVTPRVAMHMTQYQLDRGNSIGSDSITRSLPMLSVDSGMTFERDWSLGGRDYLQTLEPRLYYAYVPYRNQEDIPVFDSGLYDFNFAQLFSDRLFSGNDRIANANQITAAAVSRLLDPQTGAERMRVALGQRYYFADQRVTLPGVPARTGRRADLLAAYSGQINNQTRLESGWQYNPRDDQTERFDFGVRYQPEYAKAINVSYRYFRDTLRDLDFSGQWPLGGGWYGVARYTRSLRDDRVTEALAGLEYNGGCWVVRTAFHRFATNPNDTTNAFFIQLELDGLASIGSSPLNLLRRSVPGYGKINGLSTDPVFGED